MLTEPKVIQYYETIQDRPVLSNVTPGYLQKLLPTGPPDKGEPWTDIQQDIESKIVPGLTHWYAGRRRSSHTIIKLIETKAVP